MMSLIDLDDDKRWVPTHVNVTVLCARGLRTKGKHGSRYLYTIMQVGKEKYTTGLVEKSELPEWNEECCFELVPGILEDGGRSAYPPGSGDLVLTVMHRVLIGLDVFLGQSIVPLDKIFQEGMCPRDEWLRLRSKAGRKEKERGELQVTVQFTRNNMTASMFDLTVKDKPRSALGKLKDRVTGRKRPDVESSSAIVPGRYAALSGALGQPFGEEDGGGGGGGGWGGGVVVAEEKKSKVKDFFKGRLRKSSDTRSCSSLASESSASSVASENTAPPPSLDLLADPPSSPVYTPKVRMDSHYGEAALAKKVLTSQHATQVLTHKRAFSDEASKITMACTRPPPAVESLRGPTMTQSQSSLCINGSHVYDSEPSTARGAAGGPLSSKLVLLEKCSPLSRSLQNLARGSPGEVRRWASDKAKKDDKDEEEKDAEPSAVQSARVGGRLAQPAPPVASSTGEPCDKEKGRSLRKTLFSGGRSDSLPGKMEQSHRSWFGSSDAHSKPRPESSPKVESSSHVPPPLPPRSPTTPLSAPLSAGHIFPDIGSPAHPLRGRPSSTTPISPSNPFLTHLQCNPFFEELLAGESPCPSSYGSPRALLCPPGPGSHGRPKRVASIQRERPRPVARQVSLPTLLPGPAMSSGTPDPSYTATSAPRSVSESGATVFDDSFDAFASSRLSSPKGSHPERPLTSIPSLSYLNGSPSADNNSVITTIEEMKMCDLEPPKVPPRRMVRTPVNEIHYDSWLHRGQELAVHKEACLLSQAGAASLQHGREERRKQSPSPDLHMSSETSDSLSVQSQSRSNKTSPGFMCEEKLRKFKYEPLEDDTDFWKGTLFEQDLYGRVFTGNYCEPHVNSKPPSLSLETMFTNSHATGSLQAELAGPTIALDSEMSVADLINMPSTTALKECLVPLGTTPRVESFTIPPCQPICINNNMYQSLTLVDLNTNVNNSDFTFIDSEGSSPSEAADTVKCLKQGIFSQPSEDFPMALDHESMTTTVPVPEMNSSFEKCELSKTSPAVCEAGGCEPHADMPLNSAFPLDSESFNHPSEESQSRPEAMRAVEDLKKKQASLDDNGNPQAKSATGTPLMRGSIPGVVSARIKPKGVARGDGNDSLNSGNVQGTFALPAHQITPVLYQPTESLPVTDRMNSHGDQLDHHTTSDESQTPFKEEAVSVHSQHRENCLKESPALTQIEGMSFEDLHANVAPDLRTPSKASIAPSLQDPPRPPASPLVVPPLPAQAQAKLMPVPHPSPHRPASATPSNTTTLAVGPYSSSTSTSSPPTPPVGARHTLIPEETRPASSLALQESSPHPVKPLTTPAGPPERKEGRSVLEKLKSTIHPGRTAQQSKADPERTQVMVDTSAQYQHLSNMELISLLLQQEMDMQKQRTASEQQGAMLEKREAELKKVKLQVRDLEDYIDNLLLRIMEQTPTLLQVRTRHK